MCPAVELTDCLRSQLKNVSKIKTFLKYTSSRGLAYIPETGSLTSLSSPSSLAELKAKYPKLLLLREPPSEAPVEEYQPKTLKRSINENEN
jgi:hypothetical protein